MVLITTIFSGSLIREELEPKVVIPHNYKYKTAHNMYKIYDKSESLRKIVGSESIVLIQVSNGSCTNLDYPGIIYRYFLSDIHKGGNTIQDALK